MGWNSEASTHIVGAPPRLPPVQCGWVGARYSISLTQMLRKLMGSLLSPWAWSLMGAAV